MEELILKIERWAEDRNILSGSNPILQAQKTLEETEELLDAVAENDKDEIIDAIGDIVVTLVIQCKMNNLSFIDCVESAYNVIKNRTGKLVDGKFVKDA
jgi:NTP pyrophosphatase (non-canonical NTP hydrolase)